MLGLSARIRHSTMIELIREEVTRLQRCHYRGQRLWSFVHHFTTFGAAILCLIVATLSQQKDWEPTIFRVSRNTLIATLSLIAGVLSALAARGGFERKWTANRLTRSKLYQLSLDMLGNVDSPLMFKETIKRIIAEHDAAIVGTTIPKNEN